MALTSNQFAWFDAPFLCASEKQDDGPPASEPRLSPKFSRVVSPSPLKKRKAKDDDSDSSTSTPTKSSSPKKKAKSSRILFTESFDAVTISNFMYMKTDIPPVHTLLLGTHPSVKSLAQGRYYDFDRNAFWWIAGDCLGFRRAKGLTKTGKYYYEFTQYLRYDESRIISYEEQIRTLCSKGFALWDIVKSCKRPGSLDSDIKNETANDIRGFCLRHPSIQRIVFTNGVSGCSFFKRHFREWLDSGELVPSNHKTSQDALKKWNKSNEFSKEGQRQIECLVAMPVSPAAATYNYREKRDFWDEYVYKPGLKDFEDIKSAIATI